MANLAAIAAQADPRTLVIADEIGEGTEPGEGAALAQAILEALVERGGLVLATTHFNRLKEIAGMDPRFANASAEFDPETLLPTFRIHLGQPGSSGAMWAAQRMGLDAPIVERARELMDARTLGSSAPAACRAAPGLGPSGGYAAHARGGGRARRPGRAGRCAARASRRWRR
jgi:DNA mismatch repair protein MutS2